MTARILLDSNILIEVFNGTVAPAQLFRGGSLLSISAVTVMEMYALSGMSVDEQERIDQAMMLLDIIPVTAAIAKRAGMIARTRGRGKPDLLIAATALELGLPLFTHNARDFKGITGLKVISTLS